MQAVFETLFDAVYLISLACCCGSFACYIPVVLFADTVAAVFVVFGLMFFKMSMKHTKRVKGYREEWRPVWHFFDLKACLIMAVMMDGGIGLRFSGLLPETFIAVFYTGLGCALALAGILFWILFFRYHDDREQVGETV